MKAPLRTLRQLLYDDRDLLVAWVLLLAAQPLVNPASRLGGPDLVWWSTLTVSVAAALRGRALGEGPHPALVPQHTWIGGVAQRLAFTLTPWTLLAWAELGRAGVGARETNKQGVPPKVAESKQGDTQPNEVPQNSGPATAAGPAQSDTTPNEALDSTVSVQQDEGDAPIMLQPMDPALVALTAVGLTVTLVVLRVLSWREGRTAWTPPFIPAPKSVSSPSPEGRTASALSSVHTEAESSTSHDGRTASTPPFIMSPLVLAIALGTLLLTAAWAMGRYAYDASAGAVGGLALTAGLMGLGFLSVGLFAGRVQHWLQRRAARVPSAGWRPSGFRFVLALLGPPSGLALGWFAKELDLIDALSPEQGYIVSLYALAWARVLWPRPSPIARTVILHEVVPTGGGDVLSEGSTAQDFSQVPSGALRISPMRLRRTRAVHPWVVPVMRPGFAAQSAPLASPWPTPQPPAPLHALGEARFDPDSALGRTQVDEITLHLPAQEERHTQGQDGMTRRVRVLRAYPEEGAGGELAPAYVWDDPLPGGSVQIIEPGVATATLRDRDVVLIAANGRARLYEVEMGVVVTDPFLFELGRAPQLEDYVQVTR